MGTHFRCRQDDEGTASSIKVRPSLLHTLRYPPFSSTINSRLAITISMPLRIIRWRRLSIDFSAAAAVVVVSFLLMARRCTALRPTHPMYERVKRVNEVGGPYIGLLMTFPTEEKALQQSAFFLPDSQIPWIDLAGRRFNIGRIKGVDVIYVMSGEQTLNAGITVQMLVDAFEIKGIVHYGIAGSANNSLLVGDVSVPNHFAYTASWKWKEDNSEDSHGRSTELKFGAFNLPNGGSNSLGEVEFTPEQLYSVGNPMKELFWLPVDPTWFALASQIQNVSLERCIDETCLPETPKIAHGLRASTADIFVDNTAFRHFLFAKFNISTVDEESSAVVMTCLSNSVRCIVFRGVSDLAGAGKNPSFSSTSLLYLAAKNAVIVSVEFIALFKQERIQTW